MLDADVRRRGRGKPHAVYRVQEERATKTGIIVKFAFHNNESIAAHFSWDKTNSSDWECCVYNENFGKSL